VVITDRALHVYHSAAVLMPESALSKQLSRIRSGPDPSQITKLLSPRSLEWESTGAREGILPGLSGDVAWLALSPDDNYLAAAFTDGSIQIWDVVSEFEVCKSAQSLEALSLNFTPQSAGLICRQEHQVVLRETSTLEMTRTILAHSEAATTYMETSIDALYLAIGLDDGELILWTTANFSDPTLLQFHVGSITCVSFSPDSELVASACQEAIIVIWDVTSKDHIYTLSIEQQTYASRVSFTADGDGIAYLVAQECSDEDTSIKGMRRRCWYFRKAPSLEDQPKDENVPGALCVLYGAHMAFVRFTQDSESYSWPAVSIFNWELGAYTLSDCEVHGDVIAMTLSLNGALLAVACPDVGVVQLFNVAHYWRARSESIFPLMTRVLQVVTSLDGSQVAYLVEDAATTVYVESLYSHHKWSVEVDGPPDRDIPLEDQDELATLLGVTNTGNKILLARGDRFEVHSPTEPVQVTDYVGEISITCPNNDGHEVCVKNLSVDDSEPEMILWHTPIWLTEVADPCNWMSCVGAGGSKLVYRREDLISYRDVSHTAETDHPLFRSVHNARFAVSRHGEAVAIFYPSPDDEIMWIVTILKIQKPPAQGAKYAIYNPNHEALQQFEFSRDNTNLLVAFYNGVSFHEGVTLTIPHKIPMLSTAPSLQSLVEPIVFLGSDGWIRYAIPGRRELREVCWIPRHWFPTTAGSIVIRGALVIMESSSGGFESPTLILDTLPAIEYMESLKGEGTEKESSC
jgi:hypothetical protein